MNYNIVDFGANGMRENNREFIQNAIDECFRSGGGEVIVPAGDFSTGVIMLRAGVTLHLMENAHIFGTRNIEDYDAWRFDAVEPPRDEDVSDVKWTPSPVGGRKDGGEFFTKAFTHWSNGLIRAVRAKNIAIIGEKGSFIDGRDCFDIEGEEHYRGPHGVSLYDCENVILRGYTAQNTGNWAHNIRFSRNIICENLTIIGGHDGTHFRGCENITVRNCDMQTGDDCVAGFGNRNVRVTGCSLNTACSAFRFGGENVLIEDCHIYGPGNYVFRGSLTLEEKAASAQPKKKEGHRYNMLSAYTYFAEKAADMPFGDVTMRNCKIENADRVLHFNFSGNEMWQSYRPLTKIKFENVAASGIMLPLNAYGDGEIHSAIEMKNCEFAFANETSFMFAANIDKISTENVTVSGAKAEIRNYGESPISSDIAVVKADEPFVCKAI